MAKTWDAPKDPDEIRDYGINWAADIGENTITASTWSVESGTVVADSNVFSGSTTTVRLSGGTLGETCEVLNHVILSNGEEAEQTGKLKIKAR